MARSSLSMRARSAVRDRVQAAVRARTPPAALSAGSGREARGRAGPGGFRGGVSRA
jgi:hypothetical protein